MHPESEMPNDNNSDQTRRELMPTCIPENEMEELFEKLGFATRRTSEDFVAYEDYFAFSEPTCEPLMIQLSNQTYPYGLRGGADA